jgi:hypothetical protein
MIESQIRQKDRKTDKKDNKKGDQEEEKKSNKDRREELLSSLFDLVLNNSNFTSKAIPIEAH